LGKCLDLLDQNNLLIVKTAFDNFKKLCEIAGVELPENRNSKNTNLENNNDLLIRNLDCSVIQNVHQNYSSAKARFDSVRGMFTEGDALYDNSGFRMKDHIQIAVRNPNCIKGYFLPKSLDLKYNKV
jgi:hypothetical protein